MQTIVSCRGAGVMKRLLSIFVSLALLALIYSKIDVARIWPVLKGGSIFWLTASFVLLLPSTMLAAWRLEQFMPHGRKLGILESNRLIMIANVLNAFLPSRMGEISKAWFLKERGHLNGNLAFALVAFEKVSDLMALLLCCGFGLFFIHDKGRLFWSLAALMSLGFLGGIAFLRSTRLADLAFATALRVGPRFIKSRVCRLQPAWAQMQAFLWRDRFRMLRIGASSLLITVLNLVQIWFLILTLGATVPFLLSMALSPLAVFVGLLPITFAGVGTRDAALIFFYRGYLDAPTAGALGLLCTLRYFVLAFAGIPFAGQYIAVWRSGASLLPDDKSKPCAPGAELPSLDQKSSGKS
ncbi:MAG TPA: lysylphosphatidylglycerol synthase transmembrane domain-containing protein [Candidatus Paceibacterota bacterium]|nr:lysylphosphatidylglycerol synthase transmembrane domain-containing protein [Candidatus Paceibacterota bacterium]